MIDNGFHEKDIKYMLLAKSFADLFVTCLSRKIGALIVKNDRIIAQGVNGPPAHVRHIQYRYTKSATFEDDHTEVYGSGWFYSDILKKWITIVENENDDFPYYLDKNNNKILFSGSGKKLMELQKESDQYADLDKQKVVLASNDNGPGEVIKVSNELVCPRKLLNYKSGMHLGVCNCCHAEENAIVSAAREGISVYEAAIYTYSPPPCDSCTRMIINSGINKVICLDDVYNCIQAENMIKESNIEVIKIPERCLIF